MESELLNPAAAYRGRAMRVLSVIPGEAEGPSYIFAKRQVAGLQKVGVVNRSFFLNSRLSPWKLFQDWRSFRKEILDFRPDLVHAHYGTMTGFFCACACPLNVPLVVIYRGSDLYLDTDVSRLRAYLGIFLSQITALRTRHIICVSEQLSRFLWWKKVPITIISSGIDTNIFFPRPRDEVRAELGWDQKELVIIFNVGNAPSRKRLDLAESAVGVARSLCGEIRFIVTKGDVPGDRMPLLLNAADCLLQTSDYEGSPNIVKEALACNLPIVSVDVGDARERLRNIESTYIVERDPEKLGRAVAYVIQHLSRCNGYDSILDLSLDKSTDRMLNIYQSVLNSYQ